MQEKKRDQMKKPKPKKYLEPYLLGKKKYRQKYWGQHDEWKSKMN